MEEVKDRRLAQGREGDGRQAQGPVQAIGPGIGGEEVDQVLVDGRQPGEEDSGQEAEVQGKELALVAVGVDAGTAHGLTFPRISSLLFSARLRHVAGIQWGNKKYMNMKRLEAALEDVSIAG